MASRAFAVDVTPDWQALHDCIMRKGTPARVHHIELFLDMEIRDALCERFGIADDLDENDPFFDLKREVALQRFLGYDYVRCGIDDLVMPLVDRLTAEDTAALQKTGGRQYQEEHRGPITTWEEFESYPWPDAEPLCTRSLEWYEENLPEDMCILGGLTGHFAEFLSILMGYETLCYALADNRGLVEAISRRLTEMYEKVTLRVLEFERVKFIWGSDDMGFKTATLVSPDDLREFVLPGHKRLAELTHQAGRPYLLHSCGNLEAIMDDLVNDVGIDAKHSFEDTIEDVVDVKERYGDRIAVLGGIDVDFLCRASESEIRERVRNTLDACMPGGGYCLGSGNSVANYIPVDNYLAMLDEGRKFELDRQDG